MEVRIKHPCRINAISGTVEVDVNEAERLFLLNLAEPADEPKPEKKKTSKKE